MTNEKGKKRRRNKNRRLKEKRRIRERTLNWEIQKETEKEREEKRGNKHTIKVKVLDEKTPGIRPRDEMFESEKDRKKTKGNGKREEELRDVEIGTKAKNR